MRSCDLKRVNQMHTFPLSISTCIFCYNFLELEFKSIDYIKCYEIYFVDQYRLLDILQTGSYAQRAIFLEILSGPDGSVTTLMVH